MINLFLISLLALAALLVLIVMIEVAEPSDIPGVLRVPLMIVALPSAFLLVLIFFLVDAFITGVWDFEPEPSWEDVRDFYVQYVKAIAGRT